MAGGGWEKTLIPRGVACLDVLEHFEGGKSTLSAPHAPPYTPSLAWPVSGVKQASKNHYAEAWGIELLRAWLAKDGHFAAAKAVVMQAYFPRERVALWDVEQLCPDAHGGQHENGVATTRLAAWLSKDPDLLRETEELLLRNVQALLCVATDKTFEVWSAGMRAGGLPTASASTAFLREALGRPQAGGLAHQDGPAWRDPFFLQTRCLRYLAKVGDPVLVRTGRMTLADASPCRLHLSMDVYRGPGFHLAEIPKPQQLPPPQVSPVCDWALVQDGAKPLYGTDWQTPVAPLPGKAPATRIHFPGAGE